MNVVLKSYNSRLHCEFNADRAILSQLYDRSRENLQHYHATSGTFDTSTLTKFGISDNENIRDYSEKYKRINFTNRIINIVTGNFLQEINLPYLEVNGELDEDEITYANNINSLLKDKLWTHDILAHIEDCIKNSMISGLSFLKLSIIKDIKGNLDIGFDIVYIDSVVFDSKTNFNNFENTCSRFGIRKVLNKESMLSLLGNYDLTLKDVGLDKGSIRDNRSMSGDAPSMLEAVNNGYGLTGDVFGIIPEQTDKLAQLSSNEYILDEFYTKSTKKQRYVLNTKTYEEHFYNSDSERDSIISLLVSNGDKYEDKSKTVPTIVLDKVINGKVIDTIVDPLNNGRFPIIPFVYNQTRGINTSYHFKSLYDEISAVDSYLNNMYHYILSIIGENASSMLLYDASKFNVDAKHLTNNSKTVGNVNIKAVNLGSGKSITDIVHRVPPPEIPSFLPSFIQELQNSLLSVCGLNEVALGISGSNREESGINRTLKLESIWKSYEFYSIRLQSSMKRLLRLFSDTLVYNFNQYSLRNSFGLKNPSTVFRHKIIPRIGVMTMPNDVTVSQNERALREIERLIALGVNIPPQHAIANTNLPNKSEIIKSLNEQSEANMKTQKLGDSLLEYKTLHTSAVMQNLERESESKAKEYESQTVHNIIDQKLKEKEIDNAHTQKILELNREFLLNSIKSSIIKSDMRVDKGILDTLFALDSNNAVRISDELKSDNDGINSREGSDMVKESVSKVEREFDENREETANIEKSISENSNGTMSTNTSSGMSSGVTGEDIVAGAKNGESPMTTVTSKSMN